MMRRHTCAVLFAIGLAMLSGDSTAARSEPQTADIPAIILACLGLWVTKRALVGGWIVGPALLWAGGMANLGDRIVVGRVVDFMNLGVAGVRTGIFNMADVAITLGVLLVVFELTMTRARTRRPARSLGGGKMDAGRRSS